MAENNLNLPKTSFSMKANLPSKEPKILETWDKIKLYERLRKKSAGKPNLFFTMALLMLTDIYIWEQHLIKF